MVISKLEMLQPTPEPTIRRLPIYYQYIKEKQKQGKTSISCTDISNHLSLTAIQVRKDLAFSGAIGKSKTGYEINELLKILEEFLGYCNTKDAMIIGAGNLGLALLGYDNFKNYGLNIVAAFDSDPIKVGMKVNSKLVLDINKFDKIAKRLGVQIGIITVPEEHAQYAADIMVKAGIKAIWNFAPIKISVPPDVIVQHENLAASLVVLSQKITNIKNINKVGNLHEKG